jgi:hypothetical protein
VRVQSLTHNLSLVARVNANPQVPSLRLKRQNYLHDEFDQSSQPDTIRPVLANPALADGRDATGDDLHQRGNGRLAGKLSLARGNSSSAGHLDFCLSNRPASQPDAHHFAAVPADHVPTGTTDCLVVREAHVCSHADAAARGMGYVVRRALSHSYVRRGAFATDSPAESPDLRDPAPDAHHPRVSVLRNFSCSSRRGALPHTYHPRPFAGPYGSVANQKV